MTHHQTTSSKACDRLLCAALSRTGLPLTALSCTALPCTELLRSSQKQNVGSVLLSLFALLLLAACSQSPASKDPTVPATNSSEHSVSNSEPAISAVSVDSITSSNSAAATEANSTAVDSVLSDAVPLANSAVNLRFVGDIIFGRYRSTGYSPIPISDYFLFSEVSSQLASDLTMANLETPLVNTLPKQVNETNTLCFGATREMAAQLKTAGFHAVNLANNHAYDMKQDGLEQSPQILSDLGITPIGASQPRGEELRYETIDAQDLKVAVIGVTTLLNFSIPESWPVVPHVKTRDLTARLAPLIEEAKKDHDLLVVQVHWGEEYNPKANYAQQLAAHGLVDLGVDFVIGHHSHVLGNIEIYRGGLIAYSLGNFLFENLKALPKLTGILGLELSGPKRCDVKVNFTPLEMVRWPTFHPQAASLQSASLIRRAIKPWDATNIWSTEGENFTTQYSRCQPPTTTAKANTAETL